MNRTIISFLFFILSLNVNAASPHLVNKAKKLAKKVLVQVKQDGDYLTNHELKNVIQKLKKASNILAGGGGTFHFNTVDAKEVILAGVQAQGSSMSAAKGGLSALKTTMIGPLVKLAYNCSNASFSSDKVECILAGLSATFAPAQVQIGLAKDVILSLCSKASFSSDKKACYIAAIQASHSRLLVSQTMGCANVSSTMSSANCFKNALQ